MSEDVGTSVQAKPHEETWEQTRSGTVKCNGELVAELYARALPWGVKSNGVG
jgi:hypothetical protein